MREKTVRHSESFYSSATLRLWAKRFAKVIPDEVKALVCSGSSGMAIAAAICMIRKNLDIVYAYPKGYVSGRGVKKVYAGRLNDLCEKNYVVVDDLIESGKTIRLAVELANDYGGRLAAIVLASEWNSFRAQEIANEFSAPIIYANGTPTRLPKIKKECI